MTVKRYTPTQCREHDGTYVTYSDYQKLVAERDDFKKSAEYSAATNKKIVATNARLSDENTGLRSDLEKLGAENVGLNIDRLAWAELYADTVGDHPLYELARELPTPATDAAIAEIKAQGVDDWVLSLKGVNGWTVNNAREFAANLRAGRKG